MYKYSIEMYINNTWITEIRLYNINKNINDFDLCDVPNKRRNAQLIT